MHGTKVESVMGILLEGFSPSRSGRYGPGVFLTNDCLIAAFYSRLRSNDDGETRGSTCVIMSKVKVAEQPEESLREITF